MVSKGSLRTEHWRKGRGPGSRRAFRALSLERVQPAWGTEDSPCHRRGVCWGGQRIRHGGGQGHGAEGRVSQVNKLRFHFQFKEKLAIGFQYMRDVIWFMFEDGFSGHRACTQPGSLDNRLWPLSIWDRWKMELGSVAAERQRAAPRKDLRGWLSSCFGCGVQTERPQQWQPGFWLEWLARSWWHLLRRGKLN